MEYSAYYHGERLGTFEWTAHLSAFHLTLGSTHAWFYEAVTRAWEDCHNPPLPYDGEAAEQAFQAFEQHCADVEIRNAEGCTMDGASVTLFPWSSGPQGHTFRALLSLPLQPKRPDWLPIRPSEGLARRRESAEHTSEPMECIVLQSTVPVGRVVFDWSRAAPSEDPTAGPALIAQMEPAPAYEPLRATCRALRSVFHPEVYAERPPDPRTPSASPRGRLWDGAVAVPAPESFETFERRCEMVAAAEALGLHLTRPDGTSIPTLKVLLEDFSPTETERARLQDAAQALAFVVAIAVLPADVEPPG